MSELISISELNNLIKEKHYLFAGDIEREDFKFAVNTIKSKKEENLEDIIEDIGKGMCHLSLLYPNAGYWHIQSGDQFDYKTPYLLKAFKEFRSFLKAQKLI